MARIVYVGDEVTGAGFRLAGLETRAAAPADAGDALRRALDEGCDCVLLSAALAPFVPPTELTEASAALHPLFALVRDVCGACVPPDAGREVREALGLDP